MALTFQLHELPGEQFQLPGHTATPPLAPPTGLAATALHPQTAPSTAVIRNWQCLTEIQ